MGTLSERERAQLTELLGKLQAPGLATLINRARAGTRTPGALSAADWRENDREDSASTVALEQKVTLMAVSAKLRPPKISDWAIRH